VFEYWSLFVLTFAGFIGLGFIIYLLGNRKVRFEEKKQDTYTCGEPFPKVSISPDNFYVAIKRSLGIRNIREIHSGKLSDYLLWFMIGLVVILLMVIWL
jgi:hypothetical protein